MQEIWKDIPGYVGFYEVSTLGQVRSKDRIVMHRRNGPTLYRGRTLKAHRVEGGYFHVGLCAPGAKPKSYNVHTLVLTTHVGPCPPNYEACHGAAGPTVNRLDNLRWDTRSANHLDRWEFGVAANQFGPWKKRANVDRPSA